MFSRQGLHDLKLIFLFAQQVKTRVRDRQVFHVSVLIAAL